MKAKPGLARLDKVGRGGLGFCVASLSCNAKLHNRALNAPWTFLSRRNCLPEFMSGLASTVLGPHATMVNGNLADSTRGREF